MNITDAIAFLKKLEKHYGGETLVYFDCPSCTQSFSPTTVEQRAVVIRADVVITKKKP